MQNTMREVLNWLEGFVDKRVQIVVDLLGDNQSPVGWHQGVF